MSDALFAALRAEGLTDDQAWHLRPLRVIEREIAESERRIAEADAQIKNTLQQWESMPERAQAATT